MKMSRFWSADALKVCAAGMSVLGMLALIEVAMPVDTQSGAFKSFWVAILWHGARTGIAWTTAFLLFVSGFVVTDKKKLKRCRRIGVAAVAVIGVLAAITGTLSVA